MARRVRVTHVPNPQFDPAFLPRRLFVDPLVLEAYAKTVPLNCRTLTSLQRLRPMDKFSLGFKKLHPDAVLPEFKTEGSAGLDLTVIESVVLYPEQTKRIRTGLAWSCPGGIVGRIVPRSSIFARGLDCDGTVDSDYRGEIQVQLRNCGGATVEVKKGERVAQLLLLPYVRLDVVEVEELDPTERGEGGFGSTGTR